MAVFLVSWRLAHPKFGKFLEILRDLLACTPKYNILKSFLRYEFDVDSRLSIKNDPILQSEQVLDVLSSLKLYRGPKMIIMYTILT